jgi:hypothetical protein
MSNINNHDATILNLLRIYHLISPNSDALKVGTLLISSWTLFSISRNPLYWNRKGTETPVGQGTYIITPGPDSSSDTTSPEQKRVITPAKEATTSNSSISSNQSSNSLQTANTLSSTPTDSFKTADTPTPNNMTPNRRPHSRSESNSSFIGESDELPPFIYSPQTRENQTTQRNRQELPNIPREPSIANQV